jgi:hypothetical protein
LFSVKDDFQKFFLKPVKTHQQLRIQIQPGFPRQDLWKP